MFVKVKSIVFSNFFPQDMRYLSAQEICVYHECIFSLMILYCTVLTMLYIKAHNAVLCITWS